MAPQKPFRVIFVGGGLVGITAAHMFAQAGIDFVILEQHEDLTPQIGSTLTVIPSTIRIFDQLGILDALRPVLYPLKRTFMISADDASIIYEVDSNTIIEKNHGWAVHLTHRPSFVKALYNSLPASTKAKIKVNKRCVKVDALDDGVRVTCADGSVEEGSIVIGSDGVHSRVRQCMQALAMDMQPPDRSQRQKLPYTATYRMIFGSMPEVPGLMHNTNYEGASKGVSTQIINGEGQAWFAIFEALDHPISERVRYTEEDKRKVLEKWGDLYMAPGWKLRDVYPRRDGEAGMINLEEGILDQWSWKRIVCVGDAVRKVEPHAGLGYNSGVPDVVVLVNGLRRLLQTNASPSTEALETLFADYQKERMIDMPTVMDASMQRARTTAWLTRTHEILCRYAMPYTPLIWHTLNNVWSKFIARGPVLDWLDENELPKGKMPYIHYPASKNKGKNAKDLRVSKGSGLYGFFFSTGAILLGTMAATGFRFYRKI
ncbi:FAD/NAD(P)-binding domain-containing protein [Whalleya microplaca]|nr:FAD/NAD(P)-binding domain-containing protein [Whalleya microplaca]